MHYRLRELAVHHAARVCVVERGRDGTDDVDAVIDRQRPAELARERMTPGTDARADWLASREPEVGDWRDALARRVAMYTA